MPVDAATIRPSRWETGLLLAGCFLVRAFVVFSQYDNLQADPDGYRRLAQNVRSYGVLSDQKIPLPDEPTSTPSTPPENLHPTAYRPPLYPLLLTLGVVSPLGFETTVLLLHLMLGVLTVWLTVKLGGELGLGRAALLAGGIVAIDPILLHQSTLVMTETLATFLATLGLWLLVKWTCAEVETSTRTVLLYSVLTGASLALGALCRPTFLVFLLAVGLLMCLVRRQTKGRYATLGLYCLAALIVLAPWAIRNQRLLGRPIVTTTHGGYTFHLANNPGFYEYLRSGNWGDVWTSDEPFTLYPGSSIRTSMTDYPRVRLADPDLNLEPAAQNNPLQEELLLDRLHYHDSWRAIRAEPGMFVWSCLVRLGRFWQPMPHAVTRQSNPDEQTADSTAASPAAESLQAKSLRYLVAVWYLGMYLLALLGAWSLGRELWRTPWGWGMLLVFCFMAVHAFYWTDMRMRAPLMPVLAFLTAAGATSIRQLASSHKCPTVNHLRKQNGP